MKNEINIFNWNIKKSEKKEMNMKSTLVEWMSLQDKGNYYKILNSICILLLGFSIIIILKYS